MHDFDLLLPLQGQPFLLAKIIGKRRLLQIIEYALTIHVFRLRGSEVFYYKVDQIPIRKQASANREGGEEALPELDLLINLQHDLRFNL
jgi:hypothetical protein